MRYLVLIIVTMPIPGCGGSRPSQPSEPPHSFFFFVSTPNDSIGQGRSRRFDAPASPFQAIALCGGNHLHIVVNDRYDPTGWFIDFGAPAGESLRPGTYSRAAGWPFQASNQAGIRIGGEGRECGHIAGEFTVQSADFGSDGTVSQFRATFGQRCQGGSAGLTGEIAVVSASLMTMPWTCP